MTYLWASVLLALNTLFLFLVVLGLPGNWLMVLASTGISWLAGWSISMPVLGVLAGLAFAGEVAELAAGAAGSKRAGGTWRGTTGALGAGLVGGILGTFLIPIPIPGAGSLLGACAGAFAGAVVGEMSGGRDAEKAIAVGRSAFVGRLLGTILKLAFGAAIWLLAAVASFI